MTDEFGTLNTGELNRPAPNGGKYKLNQDFNEKERSTAESQHDVEFKSDLMPSILQGHSWNVSEGEQEPVDLKWELDSQDPFMADTVAQRSDQVARDDANWRKYNTDKRFKMQLLHDGNLKQIPFKEEALVADTFAKKHPGKVYKSTLELKNVEKIIDESDKIMDKIKKDSLNSKRGEFVDSSYSQDYTSDAEEFESIASTKNYLREGDKLFDNLKQGLHQVPNEYPSTRSDYTSEEDIPEDEMEVKKNPDLAELEKLLRIVQFNGNVDVPHVREPKLINFKSNETLKNNEEPIQVGPGILATPAPGHKGLNFIDGSVFKNKKWDVNQNKFITEDEFQELYGEEYAVGENTTVNRLGDMTELTGNSIIKKNDSPAKGNEVSFNLPNTFTEDDDEEEDQETSFSIGGEVQNLSFSQTNEALVDAISDAYPEEDWLRVQELNISGYHLDKLRGLKTFVPNVWLLDASKNSVEQHTGIPNGVQVLLLNENKFGITSTKFKGFSHLQVLDLSRNALTSLTALSSLKNLTSLNLKDNKIGDIAELTSFHMLRYLNLSGNSLKGKIDFNDYQLWFLEDLLLDDNDISGLVNIIQLPHLIYLSAKRNRISKFRFGDKEHMSLKHTNLRKIVLSHNRLSERLDMRFYPKLKELRIDRNHLSGIDNLSPMLDRIGGMFSEADVVEDIVAHSMENTDITSAILVGCEFPKMVLSAGKQSSLTHLDLTSANLREIPSNFSAMFPLLLDLNLNFNRLESLEGLRELRHLQQLKVLSNNIKDIKEVFVGTENMRTTLKLLDLRVNPATAKFYPYVFYDKEADDTGDDFTIDEYNNIQGAPQEEDEIEAFTVEYNKLYEDDGLQRWHEKTQIFEEGMHRHQLKAKAKYQMQIFSWFTALRCLDGGKPSRRQRRELVSKMLSI